MDSELSLSISMWFCLTILGRPLLLLLPSSSSPFTRDDQSSDIFSITDMIYCATRIGFLIFNFETLGFHDHSIPSVPSSQISPCSPLQSPHCGLGWRSLRANTYRSQCRGTLTRGQTCPPNTRWTGIVLTLRRNISNLQCDEEIL